MHSTTRKIVGFSTNTPKNPCAMVECGTSTHSAQQPSASLYEIPSTITAHSAWKAFQAGMKILQRYASRSPIDALSIAKSNLRLLHHSLLQDKNFTCAIQKTQCKGIKNHLPVMQHLYTEHLSTEHLSTEHLSTEHLSTEQGISAELLTLQDGGSISLEELSQAGTLYLLISGTAQLKKTSDHSSPTSHWWNHIGITKNRNSLRRGDVISSPNIGEQQSLQILTAVGENCLLLRVRMPSAADSA